MKQKWIIGSGIVLLSVFLVTFWSFDTKNEAQEETKKPMSRVSTGFTKDMECFGTYNVRYITGEMEVMGGVAGNDITKVEGLLHARHWKEGEQRFSLFLAKSITMNHPDFESFDAIYDQIFLAERNVEGIFTTFYFSNATAKSDESLLSGLILPFQSADTEGVFEELDTNGQYIAQYSYENGTLYKQKLEYKSISVGNVAMPLEANIQRSKSEILHDKCWLSFHKGEEKVRLFTKAGNKPFLTSAFHFSLNRLEAPSKQNPLMQYQGLSFKELQAILSQGKKSVESIREKVANETKMKRISKMQIPTNTIINDIVTLNKSIQEYGSYLQMHPVQLDEIIGMIMNGETTEKETMYLVELLAHAGNDVAQRALLDIAHDSDQPYESRLRALVAFGSLREVPTYETMEGLYSYQTHLDEKDTFELASVATLALGSIAKNMSQKEPQLKKEVITHLNQRMEEAKSSEAKRSLILSLANAKPESLEKPEIYLEAEDSRVREAAVVLLSNVGDQASVDALLSFQNNEPDSVVRSEVFHRLSTTNLSSNQMAKITADSLLEENVKVRYRMIELLGKKAEKNPELKATLKALKKQETNKENFKKILQYL